MAEEIIVSLSPRETRVAVVEQGLLQEVFIERLNARGSVGNIYKGKVVRVLPGLQSAFVDIGEEKAAFIHITELVGSHETQAETKAETQAETQSTDFHYPPVAELIHEGQTLLVQVTKEPIGTKGARITANISLVSRYLVYRPGQSHIGISQRIDDETQRDRLLKLLQEESKPDEGFVVRTAAEWADTEELLKDIVLLRERWLSIQDDTAASGTPSLIFEDLPIHLKVMRDIINRDTQQIQVNNKAAFFMLESFLKDFVPDKLEYLNLVEDAGSIFDIYNLEDQIQTALERRVPLKSGSYLILDQTEAMTTIDVNTGGFVGRNDVEETVYRTNLEAASVIPRQLRLRGIGGIVIVDFIDMLNEEHKRQVLRVLEKGQQNDRAKWKIADFSEIGLVQMTRKRTKESLLKTVCEPCEVCNARGYIKSVESVCLDIFRDLQRKVIDYTNKNLLILASQTVIDRLLDEDASCINELGGKIGSNIRFQVEVSYSQEQYDVVLLEAAEN